MVRGWIIPIRRSRAIASLESNQAATQAELDKTFFLNFDKKGQLKDVIKGLNKQVKAEGKSLEKAEKLRLSARV